MSVGPWEGNASCARFLRSGYWMDALNSDLDGRKAVKNAGRQAGFQ